MLCLPEVSSDDQLRRCQSHQPVVKWGVGDTDSQADRADGVLELLLPSASPRSTQDGLFSGLVSGRI